MDAHSLHVSGVISPPEPVANPAKPPSLVAEILHAKVHSVLSLAMVATFAFVVGSGAVVAGHETIAAAYMENPGPQHRVQRQIAQATVPESAPLVLGASQGYVEQVFQAFYDSPEFKNRHASNQDSIELLESFLNERVDANSAREFRSNVLPVLKFLQQQ